MGTFILWYLIGGLIACVLTIRMYEQEVGTKNISQLLSESDEVEIAVCVALFFSWFFVFSYIIVKAYFWIKNKLGN